MDSCDSAGRKNKTDGFSECFGTGQMSVVNFMDSCDGYGRSRKHGAFSCEQGTAVCGK